MNRAIEIAKKHYFVFILVFIELALFWVNYKPGTFLVGWDNLYPELNFGANLKRNLFAVWQQYRGLGAQDGMAHAANLLHTVFLFLLSLILPLNILRYVFIFLSHLLGGIGMYFLLNRFILKNQEQKNFISFCGALFYLFNLNTVQMFYAPLEVFAVHFAALPWLALGMLKILEHPSKKNVLILFLISLLSTSQGFVPTVFFAFFILAVSLVTFYIIRYGFQELKKGLLIFAILFVANAFWILPFTYSSMTMGNVIKNTKINQISSEEIYEKNRARGDIFNVLASRGFMLDVTEKNPDGSQNRIMEGWNRHISSPFVVIVSLIFALLSFIGIAKVKHHKYGFYFLPALLASFFFLGNNILFLSQLNALLRSFFPLLGEALRFPYTKFAVLFSFSLSIYLAIGLMELGKRLKMLPNLFILLMLLYTLPSFQGSFLYDNLRLKIPEEYFQVIDFFKQQPKDERIMTLPQNSFWNWSYYAWGARGSGFLWYGIEQPMLERSFDPWSNYSEQYANELLYALQSQDGRLFRNATDKYNIGWILVDENIILQSSKPFDKDKFETLINASLSISAQYDFGRMHIYKVSRSAAPIALLANLPGITSYEYEIQDNAYATNGNYISVEKNPEVTYLFSSLFTNKTQKDLAFTIKQDNQSLTVTPKKMPAFDSEKRVALTFIPYRETESLIPAEISVDETGNAVMLTYLLPKITKNGALLYDFSYTQTERLPRAFNGTQTVINGISYQSFPISTYLFTKAPNMLIFQKGEVKIPLTVNITTPPKETVSLSTRELQNIEVIVPSIPDNNFAVGNILEREYQIEKPCSGEQRDKGQSNVIALDTLTFLSTNASTCLHYYANNLYHNASYLLLVDAQTQEGLPLRLFIDNPYQKSNVIETVLNTDGQQAIILPEIEPAYQGYGFHLKSVSFSDQPSRSTLSKISITPFPYDFLKDIRFIEWNFAQNNATLTPLNLRGPNYAFYAGEYDETDNENNTIALFQAFHNGWRAYAGVPSFIAQTPGIRYLSPLFGRELKEHVLVNNWANAWRISPTTENRQLATVVIVFLPQYLEFLGFAILAAGIVFLLTWYNESYR